MISIISLRHNRGQKFKGQKYHQLEHMKGKLEEKPNKIKKQKHLEKRKQDSLILDCTRRLPTYLHRQNGGSGLRSS